MTNVTEVSSEFDIEQWSQFLLKVKGEEPPWSLALFVTVLLIIFFVSLIGNLSTCIVIYCDKTMHTATNYYLFNLAVSDLIVTFAMLLDLYERLSDSYNFGQVACKIHFFFVILLWNNSILIMTTLAVERYIAILHPMMLKSTPIWRRVTKVIVIIWIIAIVETLPEAWTVGLVKAKKSTVCFTIPTPFARIVNGVLAMVTFVIPLVIMLFVYIMIALKVNFAEKSTSGNQIFNHRDNRRKVNKLVVALTMSFLVCWLPFCIFRVLIFVYNMRQLIHLAKWWSIGQRIMFFHNWFSIVLNPILFSLMSTKFRKSLKERVKIPLSLSSRTNTPTYELQYCYGIMEVDLQKTERMNMKKRYAYHYTIYISGIYPETFGYKTRNQPSRLHKEWLCTSKSKIERMKLQRNFVI